MNRVEYIGRLTADGELKQGNTAYYHNNIAVDRKYKKDGEPTTDFFRFKMFGKGAETFAKYTHKGSKVFIGGHNQTDEYTKQDGTKVREIVLYADDFEFLDNKQEQASQNTSTTTQNATGNDFLNVPDNLVEELPFM